MSRPVEPDRLRDLHIRGARAHNLQSVDVDLPRHRLVVVTGVSGSGKSSLAFDTICREGQRRYLESFSSRARQLLGKLGVPAVDDIGPLSAAIALDQKTSVRNPRSTVGTISELNAHLRLLLARLGSSPEGEKRSRGELSFNGRGACETCRGLGVTDAIDPGKLIADPARSLREGALTITTDSGYVMYSQVTMDVLNQVCEAHGFCVDIAWCDLTEEQKEVVLFGSDRIEIPFGKHPLESRMKWSGITARPRQMGHYGGIIPVMEGILKRDRNRNILRFVRTGPCADCGGTRLNRRARAVTYDGRGLDGFCAMSVAELDAYFRGHTFALEHAAAGAGIAREILRRTELLVDLGLDYLTLDRDAPSLSGGEAQRIRLATIAGSKLRGILYVLDEPSIGLHPRDQARLLAVLRRLVDQGNSVIVVEHDEATMKAADWIVDIGPGAGAAGGRVLYSGPPAELLESGAPDSPTAALLRGELALPEPSRREPAGVFPVRDARRNNLRGIDVELVAGCFHVVSGVSGAGKSSLLEEISAQAAHRESPFGKLIVIDQAPIGRTPRSNAATYTGLFDPLRALYAAQPPAKEMGLGKGDFSFNNKGGRCPECEGAGVQRLGMHFLGDVEIPCTACGGRRFGDEILAVEYRDRSIADVLEMSIAEAAAFLSDQPKLARTLDVLVELGLGYLTLGQPSTMLSGGEAQRVKLAAELARPQTKRTLYILDEPTTGLHAADTAVLLRALDRLVQAGGTVVVSEHDAAFLRFADRVFDLGPDSGERGGRLVYCGPPAGLLQCAESLTGRALGGQLADTTSGQESAEAVLPDQPIELFGVRTHNLRDLDVSIPVGAITVITGVSGSGKTSLALDTLHAEGRACYAENFSTYLRQQLAGASHADLDRIRGLLPAIAVGQDRGAANPRSTVATMTGIHPLLRLLYSRRGEGFTGPRPTAGDFSFNEHGGACPACRGLGALTKCDPEKLVTDPDRSLLDGALDGHKTGRFYGERDGQYLATLKQVGDELGFDFSAPWSELEPAAREVAMHGAGARTFDVVWRFKRGKSEGEHEFHGAWIGFCGLVDQEYERKHADRRGQQMRGVMSERECSACTGRRLSPAALAVRIGGRSIADWCALDVGQAITACNADESGDLAVVPQLREELLQCLDTLRRVGLGYLTLDRATATLSGGEHRRLRLARQLGTRLCDLAIVLDEPTLGLHPRDTETLWGVLEQLRNQGNTLVLVEHDPDVIRRADHVIDLGPGAGSHGGRIVAAGTPAEIEANADSVTGRWLREANAPGPRPCRDGGAPLTVRGATVNNLRGIDVEFATGAINAVVGVSGSGKSSLVFGALAATAEAGRPTGCAAVEGLEAFAAVTAVRSGGAAAGAGNPATAVGIAGPIRKLLAATDSAKQAGLAARHFSTANKGGRCETCQGRGHLEVALDFLPDVQSRCPDCRGEGFGGEVLACRWNGKNIAGMMRLTIGQAAEFFAGQGKIAGALELLDEVGLSYLTLGQPTRTLSGGERQRLDLACRLLPSVRTTGPELLLCDEPTAGLHMADIAQLAALLERLADAGHTVIVTEHNAQLIARADRVIELGPGAGRDGGRLVD